ncbi:MAG: high-potential iron-sulfur protein [Bdellovibrionales bacterium]|nr:high-potential iron-sulfur protein [Bdellovibrionales bacterium]
MENNKDYDRRSFFKFALAAVAIVPFALKSVKTQAADACPTTPPAGKQVAKVGEGMAKSLEYVADGKSSTNAKHKPGQNCVNCKYYNDKKAEGGYAPCTMMGMRYVTSCGWCKSYLAK